MTCLRLVPRLRPDHRLHSIVMLILGWGLVASAFGADPIPHPLIGTYLHPDRHFQREGSETDHEQVTKSLVDRMQASGFNALFVYFSGSSGQAYYASKIYPRPIYSRADPMPTLVREARRRGMKVFPVICVAVSGGDKPDGILLQHPEWGCRHPDGTPLGYISHAVPAAREWIVSCAQEIVTGYHPDGIILDYIRYHNRPQQFDALHEAEFQNSLPPNCSESEKKSRLQTYKEEQLTTLVRMLSEGIRKLDPHVKLGAYVWGPHVIRNHQIAQCWDRWVGSGYLDLVNVSGYYHESKYDAKYLSLFTQRMQAAVEINQKLPRQAELSFALGVHTSHGSLHTGEEIVPYLQAAEKVRMPGVVAFSWHTLVPLLDGLDRTQAIPKFREAFRNP